MFQLFFLFHPLGKIQVFERLDIFLKELETILVLSEGSNNANSLFKIALFGLVRTPVSTQDWISINQPIIVTLPWEVPHLCHLPAEAGVGICCHQGVKWLTSTFPYKTRPVWGESLLLFVSLHSQLATCAHFGSCTMNAPSNMGSKSSFCPPSLPLWCPKNIQKPLLQWRGAFASCCLPPWPMLRT